VFKSHYLSIHYKRNKELTVKEKKMKKELEIERKLFEKSIDVKVYDKIDVEKDWESVKSKINIGRHSKKISFTTYFSRIAAVILLAIGLTVGLYYLINNITGKSTFITLQTSEYIHTFNLPDGSVICLNKNSQLIYNENFNKTNRELILEGEAFFEVSKNVDLPFIIHTSNSTVKVLGTKFNINADTSIIKVSVLEGRVSLYQTENKINSIELTEKQTGYYQISTNLIRKREFIDPGCIAWNNILVFHNTPLKDVMNTVAHHFNLKLKFDADVEYSFTSIFRNQNLNEIINEIDFAYATEINIVTTDKEIVVTPK